MFFLYSCNFNRFWFHYNISPHTVQTMKCFINFTLQIKFLFYPRFNFICVYMVQIPIYVWFVSYIIYNTLYGSTNIFPVFLFATKKLYFTMCSFNFNPAHVLCQFSLTSVECQYVLAIPVVCEQTIP